MGSGQAAGWALPASAAAIPGVGLAMTLHPASYPKAPHP